MSALHSVPSLKALHSFEAAARLGSLTLAADALNVSVSAVAFQVRQVEDALGRKLFARRGRAIVPTAEGAALAAALGDAFARIDNAVGRIRDSAGRTVTVSMLDSFAALWLLPRLPAFRALHPDVELRILTGARRVNLVAERVDCAVRCGTGRWEGLRSDLLFPQRLAPLCRPDHPAAATGTLPADDQLIVNGDHPEEWRDWFSGAGIDRADPVAAQALDGRALVAEAVEAGLGVGLMDVSIFARQIEDGRLVPVGPAVPTGWSHCLVMPEGREAGAAAAAFRTWILAEAAGARRKGTGL